MLRVEANMFVKCIENVDILCVEFKLSFPPREYFILELFGDMLKGLQTLFALLADFLVQRFVVM